MDLKLHIVTSITEKWVKIKHWTGMSVGSIDGSSSFDIIYGQGCSVGRTARINSLLDRWTIQITLIVKTTTSTWHEKYILKKQRLQRRTRKMEAKKKKRKEDGKEKQSKDAIRAKMALYEEKEISHVTNVTTVSGDAVQNYMRIK
ncbi:hypothetical protein WN51_07467 [Melipona quadrifasciata]|uniref:Uncharacterized protein n=1 Tax=Melipona quadrifasciata TaxID=166423 RepID=A0A0M9A8G3_9HYME|nr:hypothetical protein WN51_07467 [Melipona quadrifasciata]